MTTSLPHPLSSSTLDHATPSQASSAVTSESSHGSNLSTALQSLAKNHPESARMRQLEEQGQSLSEIAVTLGVPETEVVAELGLSVAGTSSSVQAPGGPATTFPSGAFTGLSVKA